MIKTAIQKWMVNHSTTTGYPKTGSELKDYIGNEVIDTIDDKELTLAVVSFVLNHKFKIDINVFLTYLAKKYPGMSIVSFSVLAAESAIVLQAFENDGDVFLSAAKHVEDELTEQQLDLVEQYRKGQEAKGELNALLNEFEKVFEEAMERNSEENPDYDNAAPIEDEEDDDVDPMLLAKPEYDVDLDKVYKTMSMSELNEAMNDLLDHIQERKEKGNK